MSIFYRLSRDQIEARYTHYGRFLGLVPVYVNMETPHTEICERNGCPAFVFWLALLAHQICCSVSELFFLDFEPGFPIRLTGRIG